jgi:hypothetical protein
MKRIVANQNYILEEVNSKFSERNTITFTINLLVSHPNTLFYKVYKHSVSFWSGTWSKRVTTTEGETSVGIQRHIW